MAISTRYFVFHNVTVTVDADNGKEAYTALCNALSDGFADFETDTFSEYLDDKLVGAQERSTSELWPNPPVEEKGGE